MFLKVYADDKIFKTESQKLTADKTYAFSVKLKPGLIKYKVEFGAKSGDSETVLDTVDQSGVRGCLPDRRPIQRAGGGLGTGRAPRHQPMDPQFRFQRRGCQQRLGQRGPPPWRAGRSAVGAWTLPSAWWKARRFRSASSTARSGGTLIEAHQRNPANPTDPETIYGRLLNRVQQARLTHGIRGVFWHQGENNQGTQGATGGYGWETYEQYFVDMSAAWKEDYPNIQHYYIFQIWPNSCSMGGTRASDKLRDVQRLLPRLYSNMSVMSTLGIKPPGPCHYPPAGYAEMARLISPLVERDNYGKVFDKSITPPDLKKAYYTSDKRDEIALEFDQPMAWTDSLASQFYLDGERGRIASGAVVRKRGQAQAGGARRRENDHLPCRQEVGR